jgi:hypothetical protein
MGKGGFRHQHCGSAYDLSGFGEAVERRMSAAVNKCTGICPLKTAVKFQ